jgi:hypothetical protein
MAGSTSDDSWRGYRYGLPACPDQKLFCIIERCSLGIDREEGVFGNLELPGESEILLPCSVKGITPLARGEGSREIALTFTPDAYDHGNARLAAMPADSL